AKALLKSKNIEFNEINVWEKKENAKEMLQRTNGARTIPQIFIEDHYVGSKEQLIESNRSGELDKLIQ
ncbi:MAG: glutaredoxin domain-containing protein, partial [Pelagibacteraceae bacterium]